jgi:predicted ATP-grasp superfamily ATP-dependent carboligase
MNENPGALIIGPDHYNTLGVIRSLGENRVICDYLCVGTSSGFCVKSRYIRKFWICDYSEIKTVLESIFSNSDNRYVIFPTGDKIMNCLSEIDMSNYPVVYPRAGIETYRLLDKSYMSSKAAEAGLRIPKELVVDALDNIDWNIFPCILKPLLSIQGKKSDIKTCNSKDELIRTIQLFLSKGYPKVLIQEFLHDPNKKTVEIMGMVLKSNTVVLPTPIVKIREYPLHNGSTSYAYFDQCISNQDLQKIRTFISKLDFYGIFDIEFIIDNSDLFFIEFNIRNGAPSYASSLAGLNLPYLWFKDAIGEKVTVNDKLQGYLMAEQLDMRHIKGGTIHFIQWLKDFRRSDYRIFWNRDILPCLTYYMIFLKQRIKKRK